jgi:hypothetical protein
MSVAVGESYGAVAEKVYGSRRADVLEIFDGLSEVSLQFARRGMFALQPEDKMYGSDLGSVDCRAEVTGTIKRERPRLVIVEFPCKLWSSIPNHSYRGSQRRRRLEKLRRQEYSFLELCEQVFQIQAAHRDDSMTLYLNSLCGRRVLRGIQFSVFSLV